MERERTLLLGALASVVLHLMVASWLLQLPRLIPTSPPLSRAIPISVEGEGTGPAEGAPLPGVAPREAARAQAGGPARAQNIDAANRGERGDARGAAQVIRLLHRDDRVLLFDSPLNHARVGQTQRIRTSRTRTTRERRRATPNPHDQPFLASGDGVHRERRPVRRSDPRRGARAAPEAALRGGRANPPPQGSRREDLAGEERRPSPAPASPAGAEEASPGRGLLTSRGAREDEGARVAHGRPPVDRGPAATQAATRDRRVQDDTDAELLAAQMMQSWVEASGRAGTAAGEGRGGVGGGGDPGSGGGRGEGGRAQAFGPGHGDRLALDTSDRRYRTWFLELRRRVQDRVEFPRARMLAMDQGTSLFRLVLNRDGTLASDPRLLRTSGFEDLDQAALDAIAAALPARAFPADLAPELPRIALRFAVEFSNPMVR